MKWVMNKKILLGAFLIVLAALIVIYTPKLTTIINFNNNDGNAFAPCSWHSEYILKFNDYRYKVTSEVTNEVDEEIGSVSYHGVYPGFFLLYSIKNEKNHSKIAVKTREGYLIAIKE